MSAWRSEATGPQELVSAQTRNLEATGLFDAQGSPAFEPLVSFEARVQARAACAENREMALLRSSRFRDASVLLVVSWLLVSIAEATIIEGVQMGALDQPRVNVV